jgi:hypothetical protein
MVFYTRRDFFELEECHCGKALFRFHDTTKNIYVAKCQYTPTEFDLKMKRWVTSKKQPCNFIGTFNGERPVFSELTNTVKRITKNTSINLEERLNILFSFLIVSKLNSTLQEIDLIVKNRLRREPRKIYYYPTTGLFMREAGRESFEDYRTRIFSKKIIDYSEPPPKVVPKLPPVTFVKSEIIPKKVVTKVSTPRKKTVAHHFIDTPEEPETENSDSESSEEQDSDKEDSDYSDVENTDTEIDPEIELEAEIYDSDGNNSGYDYDD